MTEDEILLGQADENGLFRDMICPKCEKVFDLDETEWEISKKDGICYRCPFCGFNDIIGWDIIRETAKSIK